MKHKGPMKPLKATEIVKGRSKLTKYSRPMTAFESINKNSPKTKKHPMSALENR